MAHGARKALDVDFALATTGIAGPDGGSEEKPVGLVWFALVDDDGNVETHRATFPGQRSDIATAPKRPLSASSGAAWNATVQP